MKTSALILLSALLSVAAALGQTVTNPQQDFRNTWDMTGVTAIYTLQADLAHNGLTDVLISTGTVGDAASADDFGWQLYIAQPGGGYVIAGQKTATGINQNMCVNFKKDQYFIGYIPEVGTYGLLYLACGRGGQALCQLHAITIDANSFTDTPIGQPANAETNYDTLAKRFHSPPTPAVQTSSP